MTGYPPGTLGDQLVYVELPVAEGELDRRPDDPTLADIAAGCKRCQLRWESLDYHCQRGGQRNNRWTVPEVKEG